ncbi:UV radiation resistance-associated gene protein [Karstenula rhodostoma CBS 690.94]|uniref:Autophagy-related protein 14 n=1 Tax=Karstenula rhodostoma CBS 690.94 TaxID=1392251 RepID=A0A9P4PZ98_9PLEO|nr:UV radiation resistance-associated gene protein [Karstenula rhodostoma CBS 690.94]
MAGSEQTLADEPDSPSDARERPWLLPYNRKLRHLQGITVRNLTLVPAPARPRGKTIDDDAIPSTLKSPTKTLALRENRGLNHSRSSSDLKARGSHNEPSQRASPEKPKRPGMTRGLRRRSTLEWMGANPLTRQKKLEDITDSRMADTFFTIHVHDQKEPVYISEVAERAMNPNFRFFDLSSSGPSVTRLDKLTVNVWAKHDPDNWHHLIQFTAHLGSLQFIGKTLGNFEHPLPQNCILFHMTDGIYTSFTDIPIADQLRANNNLAPPKENSEGTLKSSSYDAIMRLNTLDDCIQDALATRDRLAEEIEVILHENREAIDSVEQVPEAEERAKTVEAAVVTERRRVEAARRRVEEKKASTQRRRELMQQGRTLQSEKENEMVKEREEHVQLKDSNAHVQDEIAGQRRRLCEDLQVVYPIEPVKGKALLFTVRGLQLPNFEFEDAREDVTSAALGYVAEMVSLLSLYFDLLLPYPIKVNGSTSTIDDPLAMSTANHPGPRTYPLFMRAVVRYRFEYGVFLLNKNIEILSNNIGIKPLDIRQTLPNLKYLLFVATAGKGELPLRKAGGIKGLLRQQGVLSRTASMDSTGTASSASTAVAEPKPRIETRANGREQVKASGSDENHVGFIGGIHRKGNGVLPGSPLKEVG